MRNVNVYIFDSHKKERRDRNKVKKCRRNRDRESTPAAEFLDNYRINQSIEENVSYALTLQDQIDKKSA